MIALSFAVRQVQRMAGLRYFKSEDVPVKELAHALQCVASDDKAAEGYIDAWLMSNTEAPTPADMYELASQAARRVPEFNPNETPCRLCGGTGWSVFLGPMPKHLAACQTPGVVRCECMRRAS